MTLTVDSRPVLTPYAGFGTEALRRLGFQLAAETTPGVPMWVRNDGANFLRRLRVLHDRGLVVHTMRGAEAWAEITELGADLASVGASVAQYAALGVNTKLTALRYIAANPGSSGYGVTTAIGYSHPMRSWLMLGGLLDAGLITVTVPDSGRRAKQSTITERGAELLAAGARISTDLLAGAR